MVASCKAAFLALLLVACSCGASLDKYATTQAQQEHEASIVLKVACPDGNYGGTAVAVSPDVAVTARHVVECDDGTTGQVTGVLRSGATFAMDVTAFAPGQIDVARLRASAGARPFRHFAAVDVSPVKQDQKVCVVSRGGTGALGSMRKCGPVAGGDSDYVFVSVHVVPGNSGSPVYDESGNVVGIVSRGAFHADREFVLLYVPARLWVDLLKAPPAGF